LIKRIEDISADIIRNRTSVLDVAEKILPYDNLETMIQNTDHRQSSLYTNLVTLFRSKSKKTKKQPSTITTYNVDYDTVVEYIGKTIFEAVTHYPNTKNLLQTNKRKAFLREIEQTLDAARNMKVKK